MLKVEPQGFLYRFVAALAGVAMISLGAAPLISRGDTSYTNWFGGLVFAPVAVLVGIFTVGCAVFKPDWLAAKRVGYTRKDR